MLRVSLSSLGFIPKIALVKLSTSKIKLALNQHRLSETESRQILPESWFIIHAEKDTRMGTVFSHFTVVIMSGDEDPRRKSQSCQ